MLHAINPPGPGISGLSSGMLIRGGHLLALSGHVPCDASGAIPAGLPAQLDLVFVNMNATLRAAGVGFDAVMRLTIFVCGYRPMLLPMIRSVRDRWINADCPPASALIGVAALFHPDVLVEVDGWAVVPGAEIRCGFCSSP